MGLDGFINIGGISPELVDIDIAPALESLQQFIEGQNTELGIAVVVVDIAKLLYFFPGHLLDGLVQEQVIPLHARMENDQLAVSSKVQIRFDHIGALLQSRLISRHSIAGNVTACHTSVGHHNAVVFSGLLTIKLHIVIPPNYFTGIQTRI